MMRVARQIDAETRIIERGHWYCVQRKKWFGLWFTTFKCDSFCTWPFCGEAGFSLSAFMLSMEKQYPGRTMYE